MQKYVKELQLTKKEGQTVDLDRIPHAEMLESIKVYIDQVLDQSKYNNVDLGSIFSFMNNYQHVKAS